MQPSAVVFDFDGVIADSEPLHMRVFQQVLATRGIALSDREYYASYLGFDDVGAFEAVARDRGATLTAADIVALMADKSALLRRHLLDPGVLFDGAAECIRALAGRVPLAVASGALRHEIELVLQGAGLQDAFHVIVAAGETPRSKPAPDPYARAVTLLQEAGLVPAGDGAASRCVAVEDSLWGIEAARAAGLRCVAVSTSYAASELAAADLVLPGIRDITLDRLSTLLGAG